MMLSDILSRVKEKLAKLLGVCESYKEEIEKATQAAKEIEQMIDEWLQKVESGVAKPVGKKARKREKQA